MGGGKPPLNVATFKPQAPKLKPKASFQTDAEKTQGAAGPDHQIQYATTNGSASAEHSPPAVKVDAIEVKVGEAPKDSVSAAPLRETGALKAAVAERSRIRVPRPPTEQATGHAPKKLESQQAPQAADRQISPGGSRQVAPPNAAAPPLRTGDEIWELNKQLSKMAEQLADPEESKPARRKQKSPNLTENLQKRWGGTYSQMLDKQFDEMDVEEPPVPKYEPPPFLQEMDAEDEEKEPRPRSAAQAAAAAGQQSSPMPGGGAAVPVPARARKGTASAAGRAASGRAGVAAGTKKAAAVCPSGADAAAAAQAAGGGRPGGLREDAHVFRDTTDEGGSGDERDASEPVQGLMSDDDRPPTARRTARKIKAVATAPATKAAQQRTAARRTGRGAAAALAVDIAGADQGAGDTLDVLPAAAPPANPASQRVRRSHLPASRAFGSTISRLPPPQPAVAAPFPDCLEDGADATATGATAAAAKRARDASATTVDEKQRAHKASRMEQQQAKEIEGLKRRTAELELKCRDQAEQVRQLQGDLATAEKRAVNVEAERKRDANELATAQREAEKLKADLKDRDKENAGLKDEVKQTKAQLHRLQRQTEQYLVDQIANQQAFLKLVKG